MFRCLDEIAPYFEVVKLEQTGEQINSILIQHLKKEYSKMIRNKEVHGILCDLFKREDIIKKVDYTKPLSNSTIYIVIRNDFKEIGDLESDNKLIIFILSVAAEVNVDAKILVVIKIHSVNIIIFFTFIVGPHKANILLKKINKAINAFF